MPKRIVSEQTRRQQSESVKKSWGNPERRLKQTESLCRYWDNNEQQKQRFSEIMKEQHKDKELRNKRVAKLHIDEAKRINGLIKSYERPDVIEKHKIAMLNRYKDPNEREKTRQITINRYQNPLERAKTSETSKRMWAENPEKRQALSQEMIIRWSNPEYKSRVVRNTAKAQHKSPNIPETIIIQVLDTYSPNEWDFIGGDSDIDIGGKRPDFKHKYNNWIIEHFGDYHHTSKNKRIKEHQTYEGRVKFLSERGYNTLILWEHDVKSLPSIEIAKMIEKHFGINTRGGF